MEKFKATEKNPAIDRILTSITGKERQVEVAHGGCTTCDTPNLNFILEIDKREYQISGMCQNCQDEVFREAEDEGFGPSGDGYDCFD